MLTLSVVAHYLDIPELKNLLPSSRKLGLECCRLSQKLIRLGRLLSSYLQLTEGCAVAEVGSTSDGGFDGLI